MTTGQSGHQSGNKSTSHSQDQNKKQPMGNQTGHPPENVTHDPETGRFEPKDEKKPGQNKQGEKSKHSEPAKSR